MQNCPRCKSSEINETDNYCKICGLDLKEATAATAAYKRKCCNCSEYKNTDLQLENGKYICESCAQIMSELASF